MINHMVEHSDEQLDLVFHALADPTRRAMLRDLAAGERTVSQLAAPHQMSLAGVSKHVRVLERAGLLQITVSGRSHRCRIQPEQIRRATGWLSFYERFWSDRLDALETFLEAGEAE